MIYLPAPALDITAACCDAIADASDEVVAGARFARRLQIVYYSTPRCLRIEGVLTDLSATEQARVESILRAHGYDGSLAEDDDRWYRPQPASGAS